MGMAGVSSAIVGFLLLTSALVFILGLLSSLVLRVLKIQGRPKLWICALLLIVPLAYPMQPLLPDPIRVSVPQKTWQLLDFKLPETTAGEKTALNDASFPPEDRAVTNPTGDGKTAFDGKGAIDGNSSIRSVRTVSEYRVDWKLTVTLVWLTVSLYFLLRLAALVFVTNRFHRFLDPVADPQVLKLLRKCAADTGLRRIPRLLTVDREPAPMAMGFFRPRIIVPKRLLKPEFREGLQFALLHELKHVRQRHNWWLLVESIIGAAYFFHPVILWAKRRIREEMEVICDRHVVHVTGKSLSYADFLLHEIWRQKHASRSVLALPFISGRKTIARRVRSILRNTRPSLCARIRGVFALCFIFSSFMSLLLCNLAPSAQDRGQTPREITSAPADNRSDVSYIIRTDGAVKEARNQSKRSKVFYQGDFSSEPPADRLSYDDAAVFRQGGVSADGTDAHNGDAPISSREKPGYERAPKKKSPDLLMDDDRTPSDKTSGTTATTAPIPAVPHPRSAMDSVDIIVLAQNKTSMASISDATAVSETGATDLDHGIVLSHMQQGTAHYRQGRFDEAIAEYSKAIEIDAGFFVAYNNRGSAYCTKGQLDEAISDYSKAIALKPDFASAYVNRGVAYSRLSRYPRAISDFSKAITLLDPDNAGSYYLRGSIYYRTGRIDKAISDFNRAIALNPEYIANMPEGITPDPKQRGTNYASYAEESLKWHHGSLPPSYWDMAKGKEAAGKIVTPYQIRKKGI